LLLLLRLIFNKHPEIQKKTLRGARNKESERHLDRSSELFLSLVHVLAHTATTERERERGKERERERERERKK
jgi:hypothetical protein